MNRLVSQGTTLLFAEDPNSVPLRMEEEEEEETLELERLKAEQKRREQELAEKRRREGL